MSMDQTKPIGRNLYIVTGVLSMLFAGVIYAWSILKMPLGEAFGWTPSQLTLNFTLTMCFFCIGGIVSGTLVKRISPKVVMFIAAGLSCLGFNLVSRINGQIIHLYISYGMLGGLGIGMAYNVIIATTGAWFPDKKGICSGALMMGFGLSALIVGNVAGAMMEMSAIGWRTTYTILGIIMGAVLAIEGFIIKYPPTNMVFPIAKEVRSKKVESGFTPRDYTTAEMIRRPTFWRFFLFAVAMASVGNTVISFAKDLSLSVGASGTLASMLVGVLSVCNGLGRIFCGAVFDKLGRKKAMLLSNVLTLAAIIVTIISISAHSLPVCVVGLCLTGLSYGMSPTISSAFVSTFYGGKYFAMNFSIANMVLIPASSIATLSSNLVAATGSYVTPFMMLLIFGVIGIGLNASIKHP